MYFFSHLSSEGEPPPLWGFSGRSWVQIYVSSGHSGLCPDWTHTDTQCFINHVKKKKNNWCETFGQSWFCTLYLSTFSRASGSGGGTMKHAPGRVLVFPVLSWSSQSLIFELDLRFSTSSRLTMSWKRWKSNFRHHKQNILTFQSSCTVCKWPLVTSYLFICPVTQGHCSGGFSGLDTAWLQGHDAAAELLEGRQSLLVPLHCWFISL